MTQTCSYRHTYSYPAIVPESLWFSGARLFSVFQLLHLCLLGEGPSLAPSACSGKADRVPEVPGDQTSHLGCNPWLVGANVSQLWLPPPPLGRLRLGSCTASQRPSVERSASSPRSSKFAGKNPSFLLPSSPFLSHVW